MPCLTPINQSLNYDSDAYLGVPASGAELLVSGIGFMVVEWMNLKKRPHWSLPQYY